MRKRYLDEDALKILHDIDVYLHDGLDVVMRAERRGFRIKSMTIGARSLVAWDALSFLRRALQKRE